jgi:hypothetical protein
MASNCQRVFKWFVVSTISSKSSNNNKGGVIPNCQALYITKMAKEEKDMAF